MSQATMPRRKVLIVGGGTAGWLAACYLAKKLGTAMTGGLDITLIESPDIGIIGVGEGTFPTIRQTLKIIGLDEATFLRECHATFKQGIRFDNWERADSHYFHPFDLPYRNREELDLVPYWLLMDADRRPPFAEGLTFQKYLADLKRAPKRRFEGGFEGPLNYAYHFDAVRFAALLSKHAQGLGVRHLTGTLNGVTLDDSGAIASVTTPEHGELTADFYIDCTGFRSELIGKALKTPFKSVQDILFNDRAVACQIPYDTPDAPIASYTISTAHEAGWTWDIGLNSRRGVGYVYSSAHSSDDRAEDILRAYVGKDITLRRLQFQTGYRTRHWVKNCLCVGLAGGFLEPLESTGIVLIESAISKFAEFFPHDGPVDASAKMFNDLITTRYETIISFIKLHYCLSKRPEPYWRDNADPATIPERMQDLLARWQYRPPSRFDFIVDTESFAYFSYQYILYGMNFATNFEAARGSYDHVKQAENLFVLIKQLGEQAAADLPDHRALITEVYEKGFAVPHANRQMTAARG